MVEQCRLDEVAVSELARRRATAPGDRRRSILRARVEITEHPIHLPLTDHRAHVGVVEAAAHPDRSNPLSEQAHKAVMGRSL